MTERAVLNVERELGEKPTNEPYHFPKLTLHNKQVRNDYKRNSIETLSENVTRQLFEEKKTELELPKLKFVPGKSLEERVRNEVVRKDSNPKLAKPAFEFFSDDATKRFGIEGEILRTTRDFRDVILSFDLSELSEEQNYQVVDDTEEDKQTLVAFCSHQPNKNVNKVGRLRPGHTAKRYLSNWSKHWKPDLLESLTKNGSIVERNFFEPSRIDNIHQIRIDDDISHVPSIYRLKSSWASNEEFLNDMDQILSRIQDRQKEYWNANSSDYQKVEFQSTFKPGKSNITFGQQNSELERIMSTSVDSHRYLEKFKSFAKILEEELARESQIFDEKAEVRVRIVSPNACKIGEAPMNSQRFVIPPLHGKKLSALIVPNPRKSQFYSDFASDSFTAPSKSQSIQVDSRKRQAANNKTKTDAKRKASDEDGKPVNKHVTFVPVPSATVDLSIDIKNQDQLISRIRVPKVNLENAIEAKERVDPPLPSNYERMMNKKETDKQAKASSRTVGEAIAPSGVIILAPDGELVNAGIGYSGPNDLNSDSMIRDAEDDEITIYRLYKSLLPFLYFTNKLNKNLEINFDELKLDEDHLDYNLILKAYLNIFNLKKAGKRKRFKKVFVRLLHELIQHVHLISERVIEKNKKKKGFDLNDEIKKLLEENFAKLTVLFRKGDITSKEYRDYKDLMANAFKSSLDELSARLNEIDTEIDSKLSEQPSDEDQAKKNKAATEAAIHQNKKIIQQKTIPTKTTRPEPFVFADSRVVPKLVVDVGSSITVKPPAKPKIENQSKPLDVVLKELDLSKACLTRDVIQFDQEDAHYKANQLSKLSESKKGNKQHNAFDLIKEVSKRRSPTISKDLKDLNQPVENSSNKKATNVSSNQSSKQQNTQTRGKGPASKTNAKTDVKKTSESISYNTTGTTGSSGQAGLSGLAGIETNRAAKPLYATLTNADKENNALNEVIRLAAQEALAEKQVEASKKKKKGKKAFKVGGRLEDGPVRNPKTLIRLHQTKVQPQEVKQAATKEEVEEKVKKMTEELVFDDDIAMYENMTEEDLMKLAMQEAFMKETDDPAELRKRLAAQKKLEMLRKRRKELEDAAKKEREMATKKELQSKNDEEEEMRRQNELRLLQAAQMAKRKNPEEDRKRIEAEAARKKKEEQDRQMAELKEKIRAQKEAQAKKEMEEKIEEERRRIEEELLLSRMNEQEREEYFRRKAEEQMLARAKEEQERRKREAEANRAFLEVKRLAAEEARRKLELAKRMAVMKSMQMETQQMQTTQSVSRAYVYSYFELLDSLAENIEQIRQENDEKQLNEMIQNMRIEEEEETDKC